METTTQVSNKTSSRSSESLVTLNTLAAAAKQVQAQDRDKRYRVTVVSCEIVSESDEFQPDLAYA